MATLTDWLERARRHIEPVDVLRLNPLEFMATMGRHALGLAPAALPEDDPALRDEEAVGVFMDVARLLATRYFRWQVRGVEHVPATGPALLVGNHNGGSMPLDTFFTLLAVWDHHGPGRAVHPLAHDLLFVNEALRKYARKLGALRAGHAGARRAFDQGRLVLVYPGSELDGVRPFWQRGRIELGGRQGFIRLALRAQVPIVPVVSAGTHEQLIVLARGDALVKRLRTHERFRMSVFPLVLALPWGLTSGYFPYLPLPAQTTLSFGPALRWPALGPEAADDPAAVRRCYEDVRAAMQGQLDALMAGRVPFLGQRPR